MADADYPDHPEASASAPASTVESLTTELAATTNQLHIERLRRQQADITLTKATAALAALEREMRRAGVQYWAGKLADLMRAFEREVQARKR